MRKTTLIALLLLAPGAVWCQQSGGGYEPTTPAGGYIKGGMDFIRDLLHPQPPQIDYTLPTGFTCKGNEWVILTTHYTIKPPFKITQMPGEDIPTGIPCPPSDNGQGGPLTNSDSADSFRPTIGGFQPPQIARPHAAATLTAPGPAKPRFAPLFLALPFPPVYDVTDLPAAPACSPTNASHVFLVNHGSASVTRLNSCTLQAIATIPVTTRPLQVAITPDTSLAIVTSFDNAISFISTSTNKVVSTIQTDFNTNPSGIAISPDGTRAYVTSFNATGSGLLVVDIQQGQVLANISMDAYPQSVFLSPDGSVAYVTFPFGNQVRLVDTLTGTVFGSIPLSLTYGVAFNSTGTRAYITTQQSNSVAVVDTATYSVIQSLQLTVPPDEIKITPDDQLLFINSFYGNANVLINLATGDVSTLTTNEPLHGLTLVQ
jgi:YVTN family beta-propeller protein